MSLVSQSRPRSRYAHLLDDRNVKRWYENTARGSPAGAEIALRNLGNFCQGQGTTPKRLLEMGPSGLEDLLMDYVSANEGRYAGGYIRNTIKVVKSWLAHNGIQLTRKIKVRGAYETPSLKDERVPTRDELKRIFLSASKQARAASVLVAQSGLRLESLGNFRGDDGLRVRDLPELQVKGDEIFFETIPAMVTVRPSLSKARHQYFTFLTEEGFGYLKDYLEERVRTGEKLAPDAAIIRPKLAKKPFIRTVNIGDMIRLPIRNAGLPWGPMCSEPISTRSLCWLSPRGWSCAITGVSGWGTRVTLRTGIRPTNTDFPKA